MGRSLTLLLSTLLIVGAALAALLAVYSGSAPVEHTISNGREIERQFREAEDAVNSFITLHGRLPDEAEFEELSPEGKYTVLLYSNGFTGIGFDCSQQFSILRNDDYVLAIWRGEWMECYRPSINLSTVATNRSDFAFLGSAWLDQLIFSVVAITCVSLAIWVWRRRPATH